MSQPRCYWCNREIAPDDLQMGLVLVLPNQPPEENSQGRVPEEPRPFHSVCLGAVGGAAIDD